MPVIHPPEAAVMWLPCDGPNCSDVPAIPTRPPLTLTIEELGSPVKSTWFITKSPWTVKKAPCDRKQCPLPLIVTAPPLVVKISDPIPIVPTGFPVTVTPPPPLAPPEL